MIQKRAISHNILHQPDLFRNGIQYLQEPLGWHGVWNGQFEQPGFDRATSAGGWEVYPDSAVNSVMERTTGGVAGNWCFRGGSATAGVRGGWIHSLCYMPVDENRRYNIYCSARGTTGAETIYFGCKCYSAAKVFISDVYVISAWATPVAWTACAYSIGPAGTAAWPLNTRYARIKFHLQWNNALAGNVYAYVDDVGFSPYGL